MNAVPDKSMIEEAALEPGIDPVFVARLTRGQIDIEEPTTEIVAWFRKTGTGVQRKTG